MCGESWMRMSQPVKRDARVAGERGGVDGAKFVDGQLPYR